MYQGRTLQPPSCFSTQCYQMNIWCVEVEIPHLAHCTWVQYVNPSTYSCCTGCIAQLQPEIRRIWTWLWTGWSNWWRWWWWQWQWWWGSTQWWCWQAQCNVRPDSGGYVDPVSGGAYLSWCSLACIVVTISRIYSILQNRAVNRDNMKKDMCTETIYHSDTMLVYLRVYPNTTHQNPLRSHHNKHAERLFPYHHCPTQHWAYQQLRIADVLTDKHCYVQPFLHWEICVPHDNQCGLTAKLAGWFFWADE